MNPTGTLVIQGKFIGGRPPDGKPGSGTAGSAFMSELQQVPALPPSHRGRPLPEPVRREMEAALGTDFSDVRIHVGSEASAIGALAFTCGSNIYFAPNHFAPETRRGRLLLGHELAHVIQQRQGRVRHPPGRGMVVIQDPGLEAEAERLALRTARPTPSPPVAPHGGPGYRPPQAGQPRMPTTSSAMAPHVQAAVARARGGRFGAPVSPIQAASHKTYPTRRRVPTDARANFRSKLAAKLQPYLSGGSDNPGVLDTVAAALDPSTTDHMGKIIQSRNCAAVCDIGVRRYVAWNSPKPGLLVATPPHITGHEIAVGGTDSTKHAEMKLLDDTTIATAGGYIGLSKPGGCCPLCASVIDQVTGVTTRGRHTNKPTNWKMPEWLKEPNRLFRYLGRDAADALSVLHPHWYITVRLTFEGREVISGLIPGSDWHNAVAEVESAFRAWV